MVLSLIEFTPLSWSSTCAIGDHACDPGCHSRGQSHPAVRNPNPTHALTSRHAALPAAVRTRGGARAVAWTRSECSPAGPGEAAPGRQGCLTHPQLHQGGSAGSHGERAAGAEAAQGSLQSFLQVGDTVYWHILFILKYINKYIKSFICVWFKCYITFLVYKRASSQPFK